MASFSFTTFLVTFQLTAVLTLAIAPVTMPRKCKNMNYCISGKNYPIKAILKLNTTQLPQMVMDTNGTHDYAHRNGKDGSDQTGNLMCPSTYDESYYRIYYIVDRNNQTRVVVQLPGVLDQLFGLKKCSKTGIPKRPGYAAMGTNDLKKYQFYCENIYYHFEFLVLSMDQKRIEKAYSQEPGIPVLCACKYRNSIY